MRALAAGLLLLLAGCELGPMLDVHSVNCQCQCPDGANTAGDQANPVDSDDTDRPLGCQGPDWSEAVEE